MHLLSRFTLLFVMVIAPTVLSSHMPSLHVRKSGPDHSLYASTQPESYNGHKQDLTRRSPTLPDNFPKDMTRQVLKFASMRERQNQQEHRKQASAAQVRMDREQQFQTQLMNPYTQAGKHHHYTWREVLHHSLEAQDRHRNDKFGHLENVKRSGKTLANVGMVDKGMRKMMKDTFARPSQPGKQGQASSQKKIVSGKTNGGDRFNARGQRGRAETGSSKTGGPRNAGVNKPILIINILLSGRTTQSIKIGGPAKGKVDQQVVKVDQRRIKVDQRRIKVDQRRIKRN